MIAAVWVPDFPLQALVRAASEMQDETLAWGVVAAGSYSGGTPLLHVSSAAAELGVEPGMTVAQARARVGRLEVLPRRASLETSASQALEDVAQSFSPRFELDPQPGWAYVDVTGLERLIGPVAEVARALGHALGRVGLSGRIGIARTKALARLVARGGNGCQALVGSQSDEHDFVAGLPLAALEPSAPLAATLARFGLLRVRDLLRLAEGGTGTLVDRLGREGLVLFQRARGDDPPGSELRPQAERGDWSEGVELDYGIYELEPLAFVLRGLLDRLVARLSLRALLAGNLRLSFALEGLGEHACTVEIAAPTRDVRALLALCRTRLESAPPEQAVVGVTVWAESRAPRPRQLSFFEPAGPAPDKLAVTVARLTALCGEGRVGAPRPLDDWREEAFALEPFAAPRTAAGGGRSFGEGSAPPVTLRRLRPPRAVAVRYDAGRPARLEGDGLAGRVISWSGPFRRRSGWWQGDRGVGIDAYDVQLADGVYYRLQFAHRERQWWVVGWYD